MRRAFCLAALALCLALAACQSRDPASDPPDDPAPAAPSVPAESRPVEPDPDMRVGRLAVELVVEWEETDRLLTGLDQLSGLLGDALLEKGCAAEEVSVTLSTAGGVTADALAEGGVDVAFLPGSDYVRCGDCAAALIAGEGDAAAVAAVSAAREELGGGFPAALAGALLDTETGRQFLETCYPEAAYEPAEEERVQSLRDWAAAREAAHGT